MSLNPDAFLLCANCEREAVFCVEDPGANSVEYCNLCLPTHLRARANDGQFAIPAP